MGVVARQTIKKSIVLLVGVVVATFSTLFIYPLNLSLYGNIQFLISAGALIAPFATCGINALPVRFFPEFNDEKSNHGFLGFLFLMMSLSLVVFLIMSLFIKKIGLHIIDWLGWSQDIFIDNALIIFVLLSIAAFFGLVKAYLTNYQRVVVPAILNELLIKLLIPGVILLSVYTVWSDKNLTWLYVIAKGVGFLVLLLYALRLGVFFIKIDWSFLSRKRLTRMSEFALFGVLGTLGGVIAFRIDTVMVAGYTDFEKTGIYTIALYMANIIIIPSQSILPLVGAQISQHHNSKSLDKIEELYKQTSLTLIIIGLVLFIMIWFSLEDILSLTPRAEELISGKMVFFYIGIAKLIDMFFGINGAIITHGKYFRWNFLFILIMGALTIATNLYFIPKIGFVGAAVATMISLVLFNLIKFLFILFVYNIHPFKRSTFLVILIGAISALVAYFIPSLDNELINIILKSSIILAVYALPIYLLKISPDINREVDKVLLIVKRTILNR